MAPLLARAFGRGSVCAAAGRWLALPLAFACGDSAHAPDLERKEQPIIRGTIAESAELNHTGALLAIDRETLEPQLFCTATLIAPESVVTAKHCALTAFQAESLDLDVAWLAGPSLANPLEVIPVVAVELAPLNSGGFLRIGSDVAVLHLEHATSVPAATPLALGDELIGRAMVSIGYGIFSPDGDEDERRRSGSETLAAVRGPVLEPMFGSFENYVEWSLTGEVTDFDYLQMFLPGDFFGQFLLRSLRSDFDSQLLLDGYEAVTGRAPGDTQTCSGDSGGPLALQAEDGSWQTYGVLSGGLYSGHSVCDYGSVFATFGPDTLAFVTRAQSWVDPCGELPARGECRGSVAVSCDTGLIEARRDLVSRDCAESGQVCFLGTNGVECHEPTLDPADDTAGDTIENDAGVTTAAAAASSVLADPQSVDAEDAAGAPALDAGSVAADPPHASGTGPNAGEALEPVP
jgi:hypothetical protein